MNKNIKIDLGNTKGVEKKIDTLGRIVIPKEFINSLKINKNESIEIYLIENKGIYIKKVD